MNEVTGTHLQESTVSRSMSILQKSTGKRKKETSDNYYPMILHTVLASRVVELLCGSELALEVDRIGRSPLSLQL
jgi:hypothetical protein